ncbi:MAG: hypothetical protein M1828_000469 [Chrysothrix sp. TS-e1954]|nr:MAG: hypothetical protein M1828_000469 [Chrysothrix sp. TS-e1954]
MLSFKNSSAALGSLTLRCVYRFEASKAIVNLLNHKDGIVDSRCPPHLTKNSTTEIEHVFYDRNGILEANSTELVRKAGGWSATKILQKDDAFLKTLVYRGSDRINNLVSKHISDAKLGHFGMHGMREAERRIIRSENWQQSGIFDIVVRSFLMTEPTHHMVPLQGEVSMSFPIIQDAGEDLKARFKPLRAELEAFVEAHNSVFPPETDDPPGRSSVV